MKQRLLATLIAIIACVCAAMAQAPVKWSTSYHMTSDTEGVLTLSGEVADGWHVYGMQIPDGGPAPTRIYFTPKGIEFTGPTRVSPAPKKVADEMFGLDLTYWDRKVTFTRTFKLTSPASASVVVKVSYMACNDSNCMPPKTETFTLEIKK